MSLIRIGKIVGIHGLQGMLKVHPEDHPPNWPGRLKQVFLQKGRDTAPQSMKIKSARYQDRLVRMQLDGVHSRTDAEALMNLVLYAEKAELPDVQPGEYWIDDLKGLALRSHITGSAMGQVLDVLSSGGLDYLEIQCTGHSESMIVPFQDHFFPTVMVSEGYMTVDHLDALLVEELKPE